MMSDDAFAERKAEATYLRMNNILDKNGQFPNITSICNYCDKVNKELGAYISNKCLDISKANTYFDPKVHKTNSILYSVESSKQKNIRILLYPGKRSDIDDLNMSETTHNMIVQFKPSSFHFIASEAHKNPPCFYQLCKSEEIAILYFEALLVDACMCHYLGVSDVAYHHDEKQLISKEKVMFLREISGNGDLDFLSTGARKLVKYVNEHLDNTTPYISYLSIFTIAPFDVFKIKEKDIFPYFEDYCRLWEHFQKWYFKKHGRLFIQKTKIENPLNNLFYRNKYQGQISPIEIETNINDLLSKDIDEKPNPPFESECRYAVIIIKRMPETRDKVAQFEALFSGQLYQAKWKIIHWSELEKYDDILSYIEVVPFIII